MLSAEEALLRLSAVVLVLEELLHDKKNPASSNEKNNRFICFFRKLMQIADRKEQARKGGRSHDPEFSRKRSNSMLKTFGYLASLCYCCLWTLY